MPADEGNELIGCDQKRNRINKAKQPQNNEPRQPVRVSGSEKFLKDVFLIHCQVDQKTFNAEFNRQLEIRNRRNARGENRTPDQGLMSPLLYR
jgi:hypothetical protein